MIMSELEWILARVCNWCETLYTARVLQLFWRIVAARRLKWLLPSVGRKQLEKDFQGRSCRQWYGRIYVAFSENNLWVRSQNCEKRLLASSCLSVRMEQLRFHLMDFREIRYVRICRKFAEKGCSIKIGQEWRYFTCRPLDFFLSYLAHFFLEWEMFQTNFVEKIKTHFVFRNFFFPESCTVYGIMCKNIVQPSRPQMTTWRMRIACWIPKATNTHSYSEMLIGFPLQQCMYERASMLRYMYSTLFVMLKN